MILLDTNVLSALMRRDDHQVVVSWLDGQPAESIWTTVVTVFEVRFGLMILPPGRRRQRLERAFAEVLEEDLEGRVVTYDRHAADAAAALAAHQRQTGRPVEIRDVQIAGIALARHATVATRNTAHFDGLGIPLINPWSR